MNLWGGNSLISEWNIFEKYVYIFDNKIIDVIPVSMMISEC